MVVELAVHHQVPPVVTPAVRMVRVAAASAAAADDGATVGAAGQAAGVGRLPGASPWLLPLPLSSAGATTRTPAMAVEVAAHQKTPPVPVRALPS